MESFENVTVIRQGNSYFEGAVTSRTLLFPDGSRKTLGFMLPGNYEFATEAAERMEITTGELNVKLPDTNGWITYKSGDVFHVPAQSTFQVDVKIVTDYCCSYL